MLRDDLYQLIILFLFKALSYGKHPKTHLSQTST